MVSYRKYVSLIPQIGGKQEMERVERKKYFLNGVVTGSEWLRLGFITNGFSRICGPSDDFVDGLSGNAGGTGDETVDGTGGLIEGE